MYCHVTIRLRASTLIRSNRFVLLDTTTRLNFKFILGSLSRSTWPQSLWRFLYHRDSRLLSSKANPYLGDDTHQARIKHAPMRSFGSRCLSLPSTKCSQFGNPSKQQTSTMTPWARSVNSSGCWKSFLADSPQPKLTQADANQRFYDRFHYVSSLLSDVGSLADELRYEMNTMRHWLETQHGYSEEDIDATAPFPSWDQAMAERLCARGNTLEDPIDVDEPHLPCYVGPALHRSSTVRPPRSFTPFTPEGLPASPIAPVKPKRRVAKMTAGGKAPRKQMAFYGSPLSTKTSEDCLTPASLKDDADYPTDVETIDGLDTTMEKDM